MASYQILYWHDIPIQVRARDDKQRYSRPLPQRFQAAIDNAAMEAGLTGDDAYMEAFTWSEPFEREGTAEETAETVVAELDSKYKVIDWRKTVADLKRG
jgi:hypothetical protein